MPHNRGEGPDGHDMYEDAVVLVETEFDSEAAERAAEQTRKLVQEVLDEEQDRPASQNWVRAYIDEAASVDIKTATETYEKFLNQRDLLMRDISEERKTHHQTSQRMAHTNEVLRQENKKFVGIIEELFGKITGLTAEMEHVRADSIIRFELLRTDLESLDHQVDANRRKLHRQEQVEWEKKTQEESAPSADES